MKKYDYLVVGAGLFGAVVAHELVKAGKKVLVVDKRTHIGGNVYTEELDGIMIHMYGAHIFRTDNPLIWRWIQHYDAMMPFKNEPIASFDGKIYNLPLNMNTFNKLWNVVTPDQAREKIEEQTKPFKDDHSNLEAHLLATIGPDLYERIFKHYTEKQWGKPCSELPASIVQRIPLRFTYDNNYYDAQYQGIPLHGYTYIIKKLLLNTDVKLGIDGRYIADEYPDIPVIYTGCIDEFFDYRLGKLEYRSLRFSHNKFSTSNYQGVAVVNHTGTHTRCTRTIEHKHFTKIDTDYTIVTHEMPVDCGEPCYPIEDKRNLELYASYKELAKSRPNITFCGRLGSYKYTDMEQTILGALMLSRDLLLPVEELLNV